MYMRQKSVNSKKGIVLVGHGAVAKDCPHEFITQFKGLEARRGETGTPPTAQELALEARIRHWPRTPETDPYRVGLEALAEALRPLLPGVLLAVAYLEFCAPTLEEMVDDLIVAGTTDIVVVPSMLTPGGVHSEVDIPAILERLRLQHANVTLDYAWPFDVRLLSRLLAEHLRPFLADDTAISR
jgi:sirohydrochlorin cobaltochelatase